MPESQDWLHIDLFAWNDGARAGRPVGGEAQTIRTLLAYLEHRFASGTPPLVKKSVQANFQIKAKGLTNLCVPREIRFVNEIPKLGTGKINHRALIEVVRSPATV